MFRTSRYLLLIALMVLFTFQFLGTACSDDGLPQWPHSPLHTHDQMPGGTDGQTEADGGQEGELEFTVAQAAGFPLLHPRQPWFSDSCFCPRKAFDSDFFRPPVLS